MRVPQVQPQFIARRKELERRELAPSTIRRKLSAVSALFEYLCENNAIYARPPQGRDHRPGPPAAGGLLGDAARWITLARPHTGEVDRTAARSGGGMK